MDNNVNIENQKLSSSPLLNCICNNDNIRIPLEDKLKKNEQKFYSLTGIKEKEKKNSNEVLSELLDNLDKNSLNIFYKDSSCPFKRKIDELNLKFYLETEKYLCNKTKIEKTQSSLFIILFKQIKIYIEEIERLNLIILEKKYEPRNTIERTDEILKKQKDFEINQQLIKTLKDSKSYTEGKLLKTLLNEDKLKKENEKLKQENEFYKKQCNKNMIKTLTQYNFYSKTFNNFINNERGISDITKACSNLSCENTIDNILNKKRNNSENNNDSNNYNNGFNTYHFFLNHSNEPKKSIGIIKYTKEKMKNKKKHFEIINVSSINNVKKNKIVISEDNKIKESELLNNIDFNESYNIKPKTEVIVSNLDDNYMNNKLILNNENSKNRNSSLDNFNNHYNNINKININNNHIINYNNNVLSNDDQKLNLNNNKKIIKKKIPIVKVKMNYK